MLLADERSIEWNLELQQRMLCGQDGSLRCISAMRCDWHGYDALVAEFGYTSERLLWLAEMEAKETGVPFDMAFPHVLSYLLKHLRARQSG